MATKRRLHLFEGYGVELEYMLVNKQTLNIEPIADQILIDPDGTINGEMDMGATMWSNELVNHVIEIKSNGPTDDLNALRQSFAEDIQKINQKLQPLNATLLGSAAHPWMNPDSETVLWSHDNSEIYQTYDRLFNCRGHGWSNLQSTHINLPFYDDEEFSRLHTAIRFLMPLLPGLTAASPILSSKYTGYMDKRLYYYEKNQSRLPVLTGKVIPERVFSKHAYQRTIYDRIKKAVEPLDTEKILNPVWLNSRGAIARFDRGAIEIRILDIQECVSADISIVAFIGQVLKLLVSEKWINFQQQEAFTTEELYSIYSQGVRQGGAAVVTNEQYAKLWSASAGDTFSELWSIILEEVEKRNPDQIKPWINNLTFILQQGTLAQRIMSSLGEHFDRDHVRDVYAQLVTCLQEDKLFQP